MSKLGKAAGILALLGGAGCDFPFREENRSPSLVGEWESIVTTSYLVENALFRDSLNAFMLERGVDLDRYFEDPEYQREKKEDFDRYTKEFSYTCSAPIPCKQVIWEDSRKATITRDTIHMRTYRNDSLIVEDLNQIDTLVRMD